jgi:hypothetical protein
MKLAVVALLRMLLGGEGRLEAEDGCWTGV